MSNENKTQGQLLEEQLFNGSEKWQVRALLRKKSPKRMHFAKGTKLS